MATSAETRIHQPGERASAKSNYRDRDADRERWRQEAADVAAYTETVPQFSPWQGEAVQLTDAETSEAARLIGGMSEFLSKKKRDRRTQTYCRRARRRWTKAADGGTVAVWPACNSRTCADCRPQLDRLDTDRIADALGSHAYLAEVDAEKWATMSKRLSRHDANGCRLWSNRDLSRIVVIADEPPTPDAVVITDPRSVLFDIMTHRPTGQTRQLTTFGAVASRDEWQGRPKAARCEALTEEADRCRNRAVRDETLCRTHLGDDSEGMSALVQPADIELIASALGVPTEIAETDAGTVVRLRCDWDSWQAVAIRRWSKNPAGDSYERMRRETLIAEGIRDRYEPPEWAEGLVA